MDLTYFTSTGSSSTQVIEYFE